MSNIKSPKFIVIDDDHINNFLVRGVLKQLSSSSEVECFTNPQLALDHLISLKNEKYKDLIIFLDLNMPVINGWDVLDKLSEYYGACLPENAKLYIASSSDIDKDISRSKAYEMVTGYLSKPLKLERLKEILQAN
jgi:CheY-like chemotaxis protein